MPFFRYEGQRIHYTEFASEVEPRAGARPNHNLSFARLIGQCDGEMLSNEELSDSLLDILLARRAQIWTRDQFRPKRERKR